MAKKQRNAEECIELAQALMDEIKTATVTELRKYLAKAIIAYAQDKDAEECMREDLGDPSFQLSHDFVAGMIFAAQHCVAKREFEY